MGERNAVLTLLADDAATALLYARGGGRWRAPTSILLASPTFLARSTLWRQRSRRACR